MSFYFYYQAIPDMKIDINFEMIRLEASAIFIFIFIGYFTNFKQG